ncbi:MAG: HopJ type III effector protein [Rickettsiales bacterium]|jgi:4-hydroxy-tetrahydrodipicolinate reductase|nr:HopJ type III effector protein [Rickettsiales bacterium]
MKYDFQQVLSVIDKNYDYTPTQFAVTDGWGDTNGLDQNQGAGRVLAFAKERRLDEEAALQLFAEHYQNVVDNPNGDNHKNIRLLAAHGLNQVHFANRPLRKKADADEAAIAALVEWANAKEIKAARPSPLIVGYGKMGREIAEKWRRDTGKDCAIVDIAGGNFVYSSLEDWSNMRGGSDGNIVAIDFTQPDQVAKNIRFYDRHKIRAVIGTTGITGAEIADIAKSTAIVYASNFSESVQMVFFANRILAALANAGDGYDVAVNEKHHPAKKDVSGTAKTLATDIIDGGFMGKKRIAGPAVAARANDEITISSDRLLGVFGEHTIQYANGAGDRVELFHHAGSREGFASGALDAMNWIAKQPQGVYNWADVLRARFRDAAMKVMG